MALAVHTACFCITQSFLNPVRLSLETSDSVKARTMKMATTCTPSEHSVATQRFQRFYLLPAMTQAVRVPDAKIRVMPVYFMANCAR